MYWFIDKIYAAMRPLRRIGKTPVLLFAVLAADMVLLCLSGWGEGERIGFSGSRSVQEFILQVQEGGAEEVSELSGNDPLQTVSSADDPGAPDLEEPDGSRSSAGIEKTGGEEKEEKILIHICGAVKKEGVFELPKESRIMDAVEIAGGFTEEADRNYLNLASKLSDGERIRIPTREETAKLTEGETDVFLTGDGSGTGETGSDGRINLNTATLEELVSVPGIGEVRAKAILAYREKNGPFDSAEDLMKVSGIKEGIYARIADYVGVD